MDIRKKSVKVFCCYARKDQPLLLELKAHLTPLQREGLITLWADVNIDAGVEWEKEIHRHLNTARIILLLISPDFMVSEYCYSVEMQQALERHEHGEVHVIPIILRPVYWQRAPFSKLQVLPTDASPIISKNWYHQDEAFYNVVEGIRDAVEALEIKNPDPEVHSTNQHAEEVLQLPNTQESVCTIEEQESLTAPGASRGPSATIERSRSGETGHVEREEAMRSDLTDPSTKGASLSSSTAEISLSHALGSSTASSEMTTHKPVSMRESRRWRGNRLALVAATLALILVVVVSVSYRLVVTQSGQKSSGSSTPVLGTATSNGSLPSPALSITPRTLIGSEGEDTSSCTGYVPGGVKWECKVTLQNVGFVGVNWSAKASPGAAVVFPGGASGHLNPNERHQLLIEFSNDACAQASFAIIIAVKNGSTYTVIWNCS